MLRTPNAHDWSADEHEAAAAALGSFVADVLRIGTHGQDAIGKALDSVSDRVARWAAVDAASHAAAALEERERHAAYLERHHSSKTLVTVCAWCPPDIRAAAESDAVLQGRAVTHGICPTCSARELGREQ